MKISQEIKKNGKVSFDAPKVKGRKVFAPATKKEKAKKGKGSYNRSKTSEEDEETPIKENAMIADMVEAIINKNYSDAHKYLTQAVETKLQTKIEAQIDTPIFH